MLAIPRLRNLKGEVAIVLRHLRCAVAGYSLHERVGHLCNAQRGVEEVSPRVERDIPFLALLRGDLDLF